MYFKVEHVGVIATRPTRHIYRNSSKARISNLLYRRYRPVWPSLHCQDLFKSQKAGDGYYLWFPDDDIEVGSFSVNSPAIPVSSQKEETISKDIYETLQQMAYLVAQTPAALSRSEESRQKDRELERILLSRQPTLLKEFAAKIIKCPKIAANDNSSGNFKIDGFQKFEMEGLSKYLPMFQSLNEISDTLVPGFKHVWAKDIARLYEARLGHDSKEIQAILNEIKESN